MQLVCAVCEDRNESNIECFFDLRENLAVGFNELVGQLTSAKATIFVCDLQT